MAEKKPKKSASAATELRRRQQELWRKFMEWVDRHGDSRWVFRGHGDPEFRLVPGVGRSDSYTEAAERTILEIFDRRLSEFRDSQTMSEWDRLALAQHHGLPTRLLDWTTNPLVGAFFGVTAETAARDVKRVAESGHALGSALRARVDRSAVSSLIIAHAVTSRQVVDTSTAPDPFQLSDVVFLLPRSLTARIVTQGGLFSVHPVPNEAWEKPRQSKEHVFEIPGQMRGYFQRKLFYLGIDAQRTMGGIDGMCARIAWQYNASVGLGAVR